MFDKFWAGCSEYHKSMMVSSVFVMCIGFSLAISQSNQLSLSNDGLEITKTAIANQAQLEKALMIIELQQQQISDSKARAISINERTNVGGLLVEDLAKAEAISPPDTVEQIEATIERSRIVLDEQAN